MDKQATYKDWFFFVLVMVIFLTGMISLIIYQVKNWMIWAFYISLWTYSGSRLALNIHLKWWIWILILLGIFIIDILAIVFIA